jgi:type I restriction enzyme M protein
MFEQVFKNIDNVLWKEAGCTTELDYTEQTSWLLFLRYLDGLEQDRAVEAKLEGRKYAFILDDPYRWAHWAAPKSKDGAIDHNTAKTGDDLLDFVNGKLFPYLQGFKRKATGPDTIEYKIGEIFGEIKNKVSSGYNLREVIDQLDELRFGTEKERHELSDLYEAKIKSMGNAGRNGGEYYTPRPLIRAIINVVQPKLGERIYDGAVGSAGFLCEAYDYLRTTNPNRTTAQDRVLQERTLYGKEKKSLAYVIAIMNMILHGIEAPNIVHTNTLTENLADIHQDRDRYDVVLANPPFGGKERREVQQNFPIRTGETAFLFLQHFIKIMKAGGRGGVVIKNTFLSNTDNASVSLRKLLLETCSLHTVLDCPGGTFIGAAVKTVVLFFEKGSKTRKVWFYQLDPGRNMGKTNALNDADLAEFIELQKAKADSPKSWSVDVAAIDPSTFDLSVKNPCGGVSFAHRSPQEVVAASTMLHAESTEVLGNIKALLSEADRQSVFTDNGAEGVEKRLGELCEITSTLIDPRHDEFLDLIHVGAGNIESQTGKLIDLKTAREEGLISGKFLFDETMVLYSKIRPYLMKVTRPDFQGLCSADIYPLAPLPNEITRDYLFYLLLSKNFTDYAIQGSARAGMPKVNREHLFEFRTRVPPIKKQKDLTERLDAIYAETQRLSEIYENKLATLDALKQSLLHAATANL